MRHVLVVVTALAGSAAAQPKKPPPRASGVPTRPVPCAMDDLELLAAGGEPVLCWPDGCMKLVVDEGRAISVARPDPEKPWVSPVAEVKPEAVCLGDKCKKLGKKLVAAIAAAQGATEDGPPRLAATTDLKAVVIADRPWSVAADKPLKLAKAKAKNRERETLVGARVAGNLLVTDWSACAGPCTTMLVMDSGGRALGGEATGGGKLLQLDAKRFVVVAEYARVQVYDLRTGKSKGALDLGGEPETHYAVRLDDRRIGVLYQEMHGHGIGLRFVVVTADEELTPYLGGSMFLPNCKN